MTEWWNSLTGVNRAFFSVAAFFSVFFIWQLLSALFGLGHEDAGGHDVTGSAEANVDGHGDSFEHGAATDSTATIVAFKLLSARAIVTFCTLFSWGCALYLHRGDSLTRAMGVSVAWGLAGMICVGLLLYMLPKLAQTGTRRIASTVGARGTVYLDIPKEGSGEVRIPVSDVISFVKARSLSGRTLKAGTVIVVKRVLDETTVEVEEASKTE
jgi:hypothetical protein